MCPVCRTPAPWFDVVDFNKNCAEATGFFLPLSGCPVYYARCENCEFCFAPELHHWSAQEMARRIYNADYLSVDPDYVDARPQGSAQQLQALFPLLGGLGVAHLDYGSGSGRLSELLCSRGWRSTTYDPFVPGSAAPAVGRQFVLSKKLALDARQVRRQRLCQLVFRTAHRLQANLAGVGATPDSA